MMKNVSYTMMRTELSAILDSLRNGENVTITQRGKPDVVISGTVLSSCRAEEPAAEYFAGKPETLFPADTINQLRQMEEAVKSVLPSPDFIETVRNASAQLEAAVNSDAMKEMLRITGQLSDIAGKNLTDFQKALTRTKTKHADIIRALEDK